MVPWRGVLACLGPDVLWLRRRLVALLVLMLMLRRGVVHDAVGGDGDLKSSGQAVVGTGGIYRGRALGSSILGEGVRCVCGSRVGW